MTAREALRFYKRKADAYMTGTGVLVVDREQEIDATLYAIEALTKLIEREGENMPKEVKADVKVN